MSLRYLWLARLHEANRRWDPDYDLKEALSWAAAAFPDVREKTDIVSCVPALHEVISDAFRSSRQSGGVRG